mgnify:CR=1 FL=1
MYKYRVLRTAQRTMLRTDRLSPLPDVTKIAGALKKIQTTKVRGEDVPGQIEKCNMDLRRTLQTVSHTPHIPYPFGKNHDESYEDSYKNKVPWNKLSDNDKQEIYQHINDIHLKFVRSSPKGLGHILQHRNDPDIFWLLKEQRIGLQAYLIPLQSMGVLTTTLIHAETEAELPYSIQFHMGCQKSSPQEIQKIVIDLF